MKNILKYIIAIVVINGMFASCSLKEDMLLTSGSSENSTLIVTTIEDFSKHDVSTKATSDDEGEINDLSVFLFGNVNGAMTLLTDSPLIVKGKKLDYIISTSKNTDDEIIAGKLYNVQESGSDKQLDINVTGVSLSSCKIYILANMKSFIEGKAITTEQGLLNIAYSFTPTSNSDATIVDIGIPDGGFPMIGANTIDLTTTSQEAIPVPMKKLFAKINFKIRVSLDDDGPGATQKIKEPYFKPESWKVCNIPNGVTLASDVDGDILDNMFSTGAIRDFKYNLTSSMENGQIYDDPSKQDYIEFSFYMPEHIVTPYYNRTTLPAIAGRDIEEDLLQCHKPMFCIKDNSEEKYPTYVEVKGAYSDLQGNLSQVIYKLYLGQNSIDDFQVIRNQELNNFVTIKGITNHDKGENEISIDHRVHIDGSGYFIGLERETLLDSHYEVRPMRISIPEGKAIRVKVPANSWFAAEKVDNPSSNTSLYESKGNRKYFTENLVKELGSETEAKTFDFISQDDNDGVSGEVNNYTLWFYFDENVNMHYDDSDRTNSDPLYREDQIEVYFYEDITKMNEEVAVDRTFTFRQLSLWTINSTEKDAQGNPARQYSIEYFEEYLYNYASDDNYGVTTDGMPWGLNGEQISSKYQALYTSETSTASGFFGFISWLLGWGQNEDYYDNLLTGINTKYDFYLGRDLEDIDISKAEPRNYSGLNFTQEIVEHANIDNNRLTLSGNNTLSDGSTHAGPASAVEYCFNKNKRDVNGNISTIHWYLPAIDETEEILVDGFNYFPVFQNKFYWSSQPAFKSYTFTASVYGQERYGSASGVYYKDDVERARATRVTADKHSENSGINSVTGNRTMTVYPISQSISQGREVDNEIDPDIHYQPGNWPRTKINRVRCAYSSTGIATVATAATE